MLDCFDYQKIMMMMMMVMIEMVLMIGIITTVKNKMMIKR